MSTRIGGSCGGRFSRPIAGITCYENRILQNNEHSYFWTDSKFCIDNKIYLIVNIDTYMTGGRWKPNNEALRDFTIATKNQLKNYGANKTNCRFTFDNESDEYMNENFESYMNYVRVIHDALNGEFDLGAGNFRTARIDWYNTLGSKYEYGYYEVLDVHFQDGMNDENSTVVIANKFKAIKDGFGIKRMAVTEGNNFWNVSTQRGHDLVKYQINVAENIGCEDFCLVFTNWTTNSEEGHDNLTYCVNNNAYSSYWNDLKNIIAQKKPIIKRSVEGMIIKTIGAEPNDSKGGYVVMLANELLYKNGFLDANKVGYAYTNYTNAAAIAFINFIKEAYPDDPVKQKLKADGRIGRQTFRYLIEEIHDEFEREKYQFALEIMASPITIEGGGV